MIEYYTRSGEPFMSWVEYMNFMVECMEAGINLRRVAQSWYGPWWISTVWLGLDHGFPWMRNHRPLIYETMVFHEGDTMDTHTERYSTLEEAFIGHARIVDTLIVVESISERFRLAGITASPAEPVESHQSSSHSEREASPVGIARS